MSKFDTILTSDNADKAAKYVVENFGDTMQEWEKDQSIAPRAIDYDFSIKKGGFFISKSINTWFKFDTEEGSVLKEVLDLITYADDDDVTPESIEKFNNWLKRVGDLLEVNYKEEFLAAIREKVLNNAPKEIIPLDEVKVRFIELVDKPEIDWVLAVKKASPKDALPQSVSAEVIQHVVNTGEDPNEFIQKQKDEGNEKYKYVLGASMRKAYFECTFELWVNYAPVEEMPDNIEEIMAKYN